MERGNVTLGLVFRTTQSLDSITDLWHSKERRTRIPGPRAGQMDIERIDLQLITGESAV